MATVTRTSNFLCAFFFVGEAEMMITNPRCANCGACDKFCAVGKIPHALTGGKFATNFFTGQQDLRTEFAGLLPRSFGEFGAADAGWKPKAVFNLGAAGSLTAATAQRSTTTVFRPSDGP
jgi:hypothetical protein